ncbi:MAG: pyridoxal-phosphate dependent enzyme [Pseudomonadota bacterium]
MRDAARQIAGLAHRTPVMTCQALDDRCGAQLFFKCENMQKVGAFKIRGALNAVLSLSPGEASRGVVTHSSGNHAAAIALAARMRGIPAHIVMPRTAPAIKKAAVAGYGGRIVECEPTLEARDEQAQRVQRDTGAAFIHPYDDDRVIAGQGTAALELLEQVPDLELVVVPVSGGGLMSGTCIACHGLDPAMRLVGVEPAQADDARRSLLAGTIVRDGIADSLCDGLLASLSERTFDILRAHVHTMVTVTEQQAVAAMFLHMERMKLVVEPSGAVGLAAALAGVIPDLAGRRVGILVSGGNVDLARLSSLASGLPAAGPTSMPGA